MTKQANYIQIISNAYQREKSHFERERKTSLQQVLNSVPLFGYTPPRWMLDFGSTCAFLYARSGDAQYAELARHGLLFYREWLQHLPADAISQRPEYELGIPPMEPVFYPVIFTPAVQNIRETLSNQEFDAMVCIIADTLKPIWRFPEWGGHNRAMLRAAGLALAAKAFPTHADASQWALLADELAEESWGRWSIEDAMLYQPHWLRALILYAQARQREAQLIDFLQPRLHLKAVTQLISPLDILPDYGDSHWLMHSHWEWMACLEWGAKVYRDPHMKWAASRLFDGRKGEIPTVYLATVAEIAWQWCDESLLAEAPINQQDALDDLVLKKIVWRTGWTPESTYACMNYRDEGDYGRIARDYLRSTLAVSAEKMHHGHADEGSFAMLVHQETLLLHESGYREQPPDGIYRSGVYHNRVVWRNGDLPADPGILEFLRGDGRYRSVRTERLYQTHLGDVDFHRIRVTDAVEGVVWDRSVIFIPELPCWLIVDGVLSTRTDFRTLSSLWWTTDILSRGPNWFVTHLGGVQDWKNRTDAALFIATPTVPHQTGFVSLEPFRRHFQQEQAILHTWQGEHRVGKFISFVSVLWPQSYSQQDEGRSKAVQVMNSQPWGQGIAIRMDWAGEERLVGVLNDLSVTIGQEDIRPTYKAEYGMTQYAGINCDAALVMVRKNSHGLWAGLINGTHLSYHDRVFYQGLPNAMFQENKTALPGIPARFRWESGWVVNQD